MSAIFHENPWLIVVLAGLCVPVFGMMLGAWSTWLNAQQRRAALRTIEAYAAHSKDPPLGLLQAVAPRDRGEEFRRYRQTDPARTWRRAIVLIALGGGLYLASTFAPEPHMQRSLMIGAIIVAALGLGNFIANLAATRLRDK